MRMSCGGHNMDETREVKVYKLEVMVIDFDNVGEEEIAAVIENARYPNRCISPKVKNAESRTVDWNDDHPLNILDTADAAYKELFND
jgi:hypothetical protein